jgi:hypothetical protein
MFSPQFISLYPTLIMVSIPKARRGFKFTIVEIEHLLEAIECDNILSGYLSVVTTVFSQQDGIYGFKFPKKFLEISGRDLTLFSLVSILII